MTDAAQRTADHWWWRPGWSTGRRFLTWHLTFDQAPEVHRLAAAYRHALADVPGLDLIPDQWLHCTMQGLGFADEVDQADVQAITQAARKRLAAIEPFTITIDRPEFTPEAIRWEAHPGAPVAAVRAAIREAIGEVWSEVPEAEAGFEPHISIAYSNADRPADQVLAALAAVPSQPASARIASAELILLGRDRRMYEWQPVASLPLGG